MTKNQEIASIILTQLGGSRIKSFLGTKHFVAIENGLAFRFKGTNHSNYIEITLNGLDLYDIKFKKIWGNQVKTIQIFENIYCDQLIDIFESTTNLFLHF